jgi:hypothetical protein
MDNLTFDYHGVFIRGLTYAILCKIQKKENMYLLNPF